MLESVDAGREWIFPSFLDLHMKIGKEWKAHLSWRAMASTFLIQNLKQLIIRRVWKISLQGSVYLSLLMVAAGLVWGQLLGLHPTQTVFISSCLSLSSTPLVSRFLAGGSRGESKEGELDYSSVLLGMLVMQDVQLGLFIAVMPTLIQGGNGDTDR
ncbi:transmembrane and coiled-coil domain-containing protein 3 [Sinocyclocheilus grahami]|uniref:transmembrane and coiled-coil domain-containing protein 3 n=1 Tax=Sinocyclocheilus grahami TaxID=75366 RepID=UPI0007AD2C24|nr:PREDICTED: transmembrane and coiled-coil domain-containing protein 3-like [Sinocyclocheilus grahami]